jgi:hypothetical protein
MNLFNERQTTVEQSIRLLLFVWAYSLGLIGFCVWMEEPALAVSIFGLIILVNWMIIDVVTVNRVQLEMINELLDVHHQKEEELEQLRQEMDNVANDFK